MTRTVKKWKMEQSSKIVMKFSRQSGQEVPDPFFPGSVSCLAWEVLSKSGQYQTRSGVHTVMLCASFKWSSLTFKFHLQVGAFYPTKSTDQTGERFHHNYGSGQRHRAAAAEVYGRLLRERLPPLQLRSEWSRCQCQHAQVSCVFYRVDHIPCPNNPNRLLG